MHFHFHTKILLHNFEWNILVQQRSDTGKRDLLGGKTEIPEKIEDAIIREIYEESEISDVKDIQILHIESHYMQDKDEYFVLCIFSWMTDAADVNISNEHLAYRRVSKEGLFDIWLSDYLQKSLWKIRELF